MGKRKRSRCITGEIKTAREVRTDGHAKASASAKVSEEISSDGSKVSEVPEMEAGLDSFECKVSVVGIVHHEEENAAYVELKVFNNVTHVFDTEELSLLNLGSKAFKRLLVGKGYSQKVAKAMGETIQHNVDAILLSGNRSLIKEAHSSLGWFRIEGGMAFKSDKIYNASGLVESDYCGKYTIESQGSLAAFRQMLDDYVKENTALKAVCSMAVAATVLPFANMMWGAGIDNLVNHLMGTSSTGKSTAALLFVAFGSVPTGANSMTLNFLSTDNALLAQVSEIYGYPVAIEELSTAGGKNLTELMYSLANGNGKIRCVAGGTGLSKESRFSTVFLSNGETSLLKRCLKTEGIAARVIEFCNVIYTSCADDATSIKAVVKKNYGFVTPRVAEELLHNDGAWQTHYEEWRKKISKRIADEQLILGIADRVTDAMALYMVSCEILNAVLSLSFGLDDVFEFFFLHMIVKNAEDNNLGTRAHASILRHFARCKDRYIDADMVRLMHPQGEENYSIVPEYEGILMSASRTRKDKVGNLYNRYIVFYPDVLEKILDDNGYPDARVALKAMHKDGVLKTKDSSRDYMETYLNDIKTKVFAVFYSDIHYGSPKDIEVAED